MALVYFKALSDETRLRLVHILLHYELSVNELVRILGMGQSRVSRHLKILTEAGLLTARRDGLWVFYAATRCGEASDFLQAMGPFLHTDTAMREDLAMAAQILEERALKTRQFFNAIAEDWDELNREVLEDFDLPAAVLAAVPEGCRVAVDLGCGTGAVLERLLPASQSLIGVDGSARMLEMCRRRFSPVDLANENRISLRIGELDHLPLRDQEADFACINLVLHHLSDPGEGQAVGCCHGAVRECADVGALLAYAAVVPGDIHERWPQGYDCRRADLHRAQQRQQAQRQTHPSFAPHHMVHILSPACRPLDSGAVSSIIVV